MRCHRQTIALPKPPKNPSNNHRTPHAIGLVWDQNVSPYEMHVCIRIAGTVRCYGF